MGFTRVLITVLHPIDMSRSAEVELLVDTGTLLSFVPRAVLEKLGIPSHVRRAFPSPMGKLSNATWAWPSCDGTATKAALR